MIEVIGNLVLGSIACGLFFATVSMHRWFPGPSNGSEPPAMTSARQTRAALDAPSPPA